MEECSDSVINPTLEDIGIICIHDGLTDNPLEILEDYAKKDNRIKILNQENQWLSATRNLSIGSIRKVYAYPKRKFFIKY